MVKNKVEKKIIQYLGNFSRLFPIIWLFTISFLAVELFVYPGVFIISSFFPLLTLVAFGFLFYLFPSVKTKNLEKTLFKIIKGLTLAIFLVTLFSYFYFFYLESSHYSNYVFTYFHLHFRQFLYLNVASAIFLIFSSRNLAVSSVSSYKEVAQRLSGLAVPRRYLALLVLLIPLSLIGYQNIVKTTPKLIDELVLTFQYMGKSYDDKMRARWGEFYDYMLFIKDNTPEDAVIYHPPQIKPWEFEGNQVLLRYFLYPRTLVSGSIPLKDYKGPNITHILIVWGRESPGVEGLDFGWPKEEIEAKDIKIMGEVYKGTKVYRPDLGIFKDKRGLIEL